MKKILFVLVLTLIQRTTAYAGTGSNVPPAVITREANEDFGSWVKHGKLIYQSADLDGARFGWYVYQPQSGGPVFLSGRLDGVNDLLGGEVSQGFAETFLSEHLASVLVATMAPVGSYIVTKKFVDAFSSGDSRVPILRRYSLEPTPRISGDEWKLDFNVASNLGGIERWHVVGRLSPLRIESFERDIAERNGSFDPILVTQAIGSDGH